MIITWILVAAGVLALGMLAYIAMRTRASDPGIEGAISLIRSIDIEAFRNLVDPAEEEFLRCTLSPRDFRKIKRERDWAALAYVRSAGRAAVQFAKAGQAAQRSSDPEIAESGMQIAHSALRLRLYTLQGGIRLVGQAVLPGTSNRPLSSLLDQYERTAESLLRLGRLRNEQNV
ncbi:MAG: hypothetical protein WAQ52_02235 [Terriglobales bacterium]